MKKFILIIILIFFSGVVQAEDHIWNGNISLLYQQRYLALKISKEVYNSPMFWVNTNLNHSPTGLFTNLWWSNNSQFRGSFNSERGNEFDSTFGWKKYYNKYCAEISATLYNIHFSDWNSNAWIQTVKLGRVVNSKFKPEIWLEWISPLDHFKNGEPVITLNLPYVYKNPFDIDKLSLNFVNLLVWENGFGDTDTSGIFLRQYFGAEYFMQNDISLFSGITPLWKLTKTNDDRKNNYTCCFGIKYVF